VDTLPIADAVGLAAGIRWLEQFDRNEMNAYEEKLLHHACDVLGTINGVTLLGPKDATKRFGCVSFTVDGVHPHDLTEVLGREGFCLRAGHNCAMPLHKHLGVSASSRLSVAIYNTKEEIDACAKAIADLAPQLKK
jgi:cysteine desulfurase/selenocysteine lyase